MSGKKVAFMGSSSPKAQEALGVLEKRYGNVAVEDAEVVVAIGGDGFMLQTLHRTMSSGLPIYGMNRGTIGFLMNQYAEDDLMERLEKAETSELHPLRMHAVRDAGTEMEALAINEVSLLRQTRQAAKVRISINGKVRVEELICDGILVSTAAGSTAYNLSAHGPILPLNAGVLALTPISPFRPRRWRGALLSREVRIKLEILDHFKRPVSATADATEVRDVVSVTIEEARDVALKVLFDPEHNLEERVLQEQFVP